MTWHCGDIDSHAVRSKHFWASESVLSSIVAHDLKERRNIPALPGATLCPYRRGGGHPALSTIAAAAPQALEELPCMLYLAAAVLTAA